MAELKPCPFCKDGGLVKDKYGFGQGKNESD